MTERYRLVSDDDGHHFVIPANNQTAWEAYLQDVYGDEDISQPAWAHEVGGAPSQVTFEAPHIFGKPLKEA